METIYEAVTLELDPCSGYERIELRAPRELAIELKELLRLEGEDAGFLLQFSAARTTATAVIGLVASKTAWMSLERVIEYLFKRDADKEFELTYKEHRVRAKGYSSRDLAALLYAAAEAFEKKQAADVLAATSAEALEGCQSPNR